MVVEEQSACNIEGNEHVDTVVFMCREDKEDSKTVTQPGKRMEEDNSARRVLRDEEVEERERHGVTGEHVVSACSNALKTHPRP